MKNFRLGLFGKKYKDTIINLDNFITGESNFAKHIQKKLGGIYNIKRSFIKDIDFEIFEEGEVDVLIINEIEKSIRSSILSDPISYKELQISSKIDFLHVCYIDDVHTLDFIDFEKNKVSVDFCTLKNRIDYLDVLKKCELIFDSRERKFLYKDVLISTPIILHDENGCECIINGKKVSESKIVPEKGIVKNGAGDIFAGIFLKKYFYKNIQTAINETANETKEYLLTYEI